MNCDHCAHSGICKYESDILLMMIRSMQYRKAVIQSRLTPSRHVLPFFSSVVSLSSILSHLLISLHILQVREHSIQHLYVK